MFIFLYTGFKMQSFISVECSKWCIWILFLSFTREL
jgi:hypothetical protein